MGLMEFQASRVSLVLMDDLDLPDCQAKTDCLVCLV